jgi:hypothetical protein
VTPATAPPASASPPTTPSAPAPPATSATATTPHRASAPSAPIATPHTNLPSSASTAAAVTSAPKARVEGALGSSSPSSVSGVASGVSHRVAAVSRDGQAVLAHPAANVTALGAAADRVISSTTRLATAPSSGSLLSEAGKLIDGSPAGSLAAPVRTALPEAPLLDAAGVSSSSPPREPTPEFRAGSDVAPAPRHEWTAAVLGGPAGSSIGAYPPRAQTFSLPLGDTTRARAASKVALFRYGISGLGSSSSTFASFVSSMHPPTEQRDPKGPARERAPLWPLPGHGALGGLGNGAGATFLLLLASLAGALFWAAPRLGRRLRSTPDLVSLRYVLALDVPG